MKTRISLTCLAAFALLLAPIVPVMAQDENPALSLLSDDIVFYLSFDHGLAADLSNGDPTPASVTGEARFELGRFGQAVVLGEGGLHRAEYASWQNIDFSSPGAMSMWIAPHDWLPRDETDRRPYLRFFNHRAAREGSIFVQRQGFADYTREDGTRSRRLDRFQVGYYSFPDADNALFQHPDSDRWADGQWQFIVINWDRNSFAVSINGSTPRSVELTRPISNEDFPGEDARLVMTLGYGNSPETTLLDEVIVYRRPLQPAEIEKLYVQ